MTAARHFRAARKALPASFLSERDRDLMRYADRDTPPAFQSLETATQIARDESRRLGATLVVLDESRGGSPHFVVRLAVAVAVPRGGR